MRLLVILALFFVGTLAIQHHLSTERRNGLRMFYTRDLDYSGADLETISCPDAATAIKYARSKVDFEKNIIMMWNPNSQR
jgi:hypothetical protein